MYDQFYGLQSRPFQLTPDPHYYFESATHRKALSYLGYGLAQGEGFIVITGDIGAGKTTLVGHLMQTIDPARLTAVKIVSTQVEGDDMLRLAAQSFGLATEGMTKASTLQQIEGFLHMQARAGRRSLLIVDEAQNLPVSAIEELRMLSNFQLGGQSLLQIFLLGQPEFRDLLKSPQLEQLRQRVIATHHLEPMMVSEIEPYILHRLGIAGWSGNPAFTPGAFAALYTATGGVPRRLNALTSRVLLLGAIEQLYVIDEEVVGAVVADMGLDADVALQPAAPSVLDVVAEPVEFDAVAVADVAEEPEAFVAEEAMVQAPVEDDVVVADDTVELDAAWAEPPVAAEFPADPEPAVTPFAPAEAEFSAPVEPVFARFARPAFAVVQAAEPVEDEQDVEPEQAVAEPDAVADAPSFVADQGMTDAAIAATVDAAEIEALRVDMLGEIEALRAEIASLRAVQSHVPFAAPQPAIDAEALKSCFTLIEERLSALEFRAEEQDTALRRVLTLLVDWVEREEQMSETQAGFAVA